jgi:hypothetical protein
VSRAVLGGSGPLIHELGVATLIMPGVAEAAAAAARARSTRP